MRKHIQALMVAENEVTIGRRTSDRIKAYQSGSGQTLHTVIRIHTTPAAFQAAQQSVVAPYIPTGTACHLSRARAMVGKAQKVLGCKFEWFPYGRTGVILYTNQLTAKPAALQP